MVESITPVQPCGELALFYCRVLKLLPFFDFVSAINVNDNPFSSVLDGLPVVSAMIPAAEVQGSISSVIW
jgi:hypothetical protein